MKRLLPLIAILLAACTAAPAATTTPTPSPTIQDCSKIALADSSASGTDALPSITMECLQGSQKIDVSRLRGPMLMPVWASWCEPCADEMPLMQQFFSAYHQQVEVLGYALMDTTEQAIAGSFNWGVTLPSVEDPDGAYRGWLNVQAPPTTLFIDANGHIVFRKVGAFASLEEVKVAVEQHLGIALS